MSNGESTMIVTISKGQQVTIPAKLRNKLGLVMGSKIEMIDDDGQIILKPVGDDLRHIFAQAKKVVPKRALTPEQIDELNERLFR